MKGTVMKDKKRGQKPNCETFSEANFQEEVKDSRLPVLAVFEADWSGTCHIMTPIIEDLCRQFRGRVKIGMVDIESNVKLAASCGIQKTPSLVFFNNGEIVDMITGSVPKQMISDKLNDLVVPTDR